MLKAENFQEKFLTGWFYIIDSLTEKIINRIPIIGEKNIDNFFVWSPIILPTPPDLYLAPRIHHPALRTINPQKAVSNPSTH